MAVEGAATAGAVPGDLERRIVTVLLADLVGFTTLAERLDAEDVAAVQDAYFSAVRDTIARHDGQMEKSIGDAAMAVFGVPPGRDDDAERAVRAGLALVAAVEQLEIATPDEVAERAAREAALGVVRPTLRTRLAALPRSG